MTKFVKITSREEALQFAGRMWMQPFGLRDDLLRIASCDVEAFLECRQFFQHLRLNNALDASLMYARALRQHVDIVHAHGVEPAGAACAQASDQRAEING